MLYVSLMMSDTYSIIGLDGLSGADREKLLLEAIAEQAARIRSLEKELAAERKLNKRLKRQKACDGKLLDELRAELRRVFAVRPIGGGATFSASSGGAVPRG